MAAILLQLLGVTITMRPTVQAVMREIIEPVLIGKIPAENYITLASYAIVQVVVMYIIPMERLIEDEPEDTQFAAVIGISR